VQCVSRHSSSGMGTATACSPTLPTAASSVLKASLAGGAPRRQSPGFTELQGKSCRCSSTRYLGKPSIIDLRHPAGVPVWVKKGDNPPLAVAPLPSWNTRQIGTLSPCKVATLTRRSDSVTLRHGAVQPALPSSESVGVASFRVTGRRLPRPSGAVALRARDQ